MQFQPLKDVEYRFVSALDPNMVLEVGLHHKVHLMKWVKGANQRFNIILSGNGKYTINSAKHKQQAIGVKDNAQGNEALIESFKSQKSNGELWELVPCNLQEYYGKNAFYLRSHCGKALDVFGGKAAQDGKIVQYDYNGNKNQIWFIEPATFVPQEGVYYKLASALNKKMVLDMSGNPADHKKMLLYKYHGGDNQKFKIQIYNDKFFLTCKQDNVALQIQNGSGDNGAILHAAQHKKQNHEQFELVPCTHPDHTCKNSFFIRTHSGKAVDVKGGKANEQAPVIQWDFTGNENQIWYIQKAQ